MSDFHQLFDVFCVLLVGGFERVLPVANLFHFVDCVVKLFEIVFDVADEQLFFIARFRTDGCARFFVLARKRAHIEKSAFAFNLIAKHIATARLCKYFEVGASTSSCVFIGKSAFLAFAKNVL